MNNILVFDIETIPDVEGIRRLGDFPDTLSHQDVLDAFCTQLRAEKGHDFIPLHLQRIVAISCCLRYEPNKIHIATLGNLDDDEATFIQKFFAIIDERMPTLVSFNGGGFDLPVLHYRALIHQITAPRYWDMGDGDDLQSQRAMRFNNYINRFHMRHCDVMDVLARYQPRAFVPLDDLAKLCGFPGKMGMDGSQVYAAYCDGKLQEIRDYCETDVANTYLIYLRFALMRGILNHTSYAAEIALMQNYLQQKSAAHWQEFLQKWHLNS